MSENFLRFWNDLQQDAWETYYGDPSMHQDPELPGELHDEEPCSTTSNPTESSTTPSTPTTGISV